MPKLGPGRTIHHGHLLLGVVELPKYFARAKMAGVTGGLMCFPPWAGIQFRDSKTADVGDPFVCPDKTVLIFTELSLLAPKPQVFDRPHWGSTVTLTVGDMPQATFPLQLLLGGSGRQALRARYSTLDDDDSAASMIGIACPPRQHWSLDLSFEPDDHGTPRPPQDAYHFALAYTSVRRNG